MSAPDALKLYVDTLERAGLGRQQMTIYLKAMTPDASRLILLPINE